MQVDVIDSVDGISVDAFEQLDPSAGAAGSHARTRQREADGRWRCRYLRCVEDGQLVALIPLYAPRGGNWPDAEYYDPRTWPFPLGAGDDCVASRSLLVGGCADLRTSFPVAAGTRDRRTVSAILASIARLAVEEDRCLVFPYQYGEAQRMLAEASDGAITWTSLGREARMRGVSEPDWESALRKRVRYRLRHDRRLIAQAGLASTVHPWAEVEGPASEMIAEHNQRKGKADHPEFVKMRSRQWAACDSVEFVVFATRSSTVSGFLTAFVWRDELEIYEIGLRGEEGDDRLAAYVDLVIHQPLRLAGERGLRNIRLGPKAEWIKSSRGADLEELYGGVLNARDTKRVADG